MLMQTLREYMKCSTLCPKEPLLEKDVKLENVVRFIIGEESSSKLGYWLRIARLSMVGSVRMSIGRPKHSALCEIFHEDFHRNYVYLHHCMSDGCGDRSNAVGKMLFRDNIVFEITASYASLLEGSALSHANILFDVADDLKMDDESWKDCLLWILVTGFSGFHHSPGSGGRIDTKCECGSSVHTFSEFGGRLNTVVSVKRDGRKLFKTLVIGHPFVHTLHQSLSTKFALKAYTRYTNMNFQHLVYNGDDIVDGDENGDDNFSIL